MPLHVTAAPAPEVLRAFALEAARLGLEPYELLGADLDGRVTAQLGPLPAGALDVADDDARRCLRALAAASALDPGDVEAAGELGYGRWVPFEVVPFAWQGGSGLQYGHLVLAEELGAQDWLAVSFAPSELIVSWLGDDTAHALANLLATTAAHDPEDADDGEAVREARARLSRALALPRGEVLGRGARSGRRAVPIVPPGYRHVVGREGVGVLAPERAFAELDPASVPFEALEDRAAAALADGHPATALQLLAIQRRDADGAGERAACERMIAVYEALGRPLMARRVEAHLRVSSFG